MASKTATANQRLDWQPEHALGTPGHYPYTRGIHQKMYRNRHWFNRTLLRGAALRLIRAADNDALMSALLAW